MTDKKYQLEYYHRNKDRINEQRKRKRLNNNGHTDHSTTKTGWKLWPEARGHWITQDHIVNSIFMIANESLDAKILELIKDKLNIIKEILIWKLIKKKY